MAIFKTEFSKEEFLALGEFDTKQEAPSDKTPFLLKTDRWIQQKEALLEILEKVSKANNVQLDMLKKSREELKVKFLVRHKDGNISEQGGFIRMAKVIADLTVAPQVKDGVLTIETGA